MSFNHQDGLRYLGFDIFQDQPIVQATFTRLGGCSPEPWQSLNMGGSVGDDPIRVIENRRKAFSVVGRSPESVFDVWQVHSAEVVCATAPRPRDQSPQQADAILTDKDHVTLLMRFADCVPVMLFNPITKVVGLVHAGWQGTVKKVVKEAVVVMHSQYHSNPQDILAAIGPSIGSCHYEVGEDVIRYVHLAFGMDAPALLKPIQVQYDASQSSNLPLAFDLWSANRLLLEQAGVRHVQIAGLCTACHTEDWFSHREEKGKTGRFGVLIGLKNGI
jgi:YfiH family protein